MRVFPVGSRVAYVRHRTPNRPVFTVVHAYVNETVGLLYTLRQPHGELVRAVAPENLELVAAAPVAPAAVAEPPAVAALPPVLPAPVSHCRRCGSAKCICGGQEKARWLALTAATSAEAVARAVAIGRAS